jgi:hypothetical protein
MGRDPPFESEVAAIILPNFRDRGLTIAVAIHSTLQELAKLANHALNIALFEPGRGGTNATHPDAVDDFASARLQLRTSSRSLVF